MTKKEAKPRAGKVDRYVGARIRERRVMLGLTLQKLAELIGVTYQQAQKYDRGLNRVSAGRLYVIAQALNVPVGYFYEGLENDGAQAATPRQRMTLEVARNFTQITNRRHQEALSFLAGVLSRD